MAVRKTESKKRPAGLERITAIPSPPPRPDDSNKGTFGKVLIVAGSRGMSGAACLSALGALRGGAGLVTVAVPEGIANTVAGVEPSYLTMPLPEDADGRFSGAAREKLDPIVSQQTAVAVGPGLGKSVSLTGLVGGLFSSIQGPAVFDADALNLLAASPSPLLARSRSQQEPPPRILTPHPGEFGRLIGKSAAEVQKDRERLSADFARDRRLVLVLKGRGTIITDGRRLAVNATGNSGMATGGSGDVLTGLIAALLAQGLSAFDAAQLGAHVHGLAGDLAVAELSNPGLIASDLPRWLPAAWRELAKKQKPSRRRQ